MSASGSTGMPGEFNDFEHLTIQSSPWENFSMSNDFSLENDAAPEPAMQGQAKPSDALVKKEDKNSASGLLLMLLLCGAWVVSKGSNDTKEILPTMPDELRAASASVIEDLYKGSGIQIPEDDAATITTHDHQPRPSTASFDGSMSAYVMNTINAQPAHNIHQDHFVQNPANVQSMGNMLRDAMRSVNTQNPPPADTYTKSLLADKVPSQVLKDFAQMIAHNRQPKPEPNMPQQMSQPTYD